MLLWKGRRIGVLLMGWLGRGDAGRGVIFGLGLVLRRVSGVSWLEGSRGFDANTLQIHSNV